MPETTFLCILEPVCYICHPVLLLFSCISLQTCPGNRSTLSSMPSLGTQTVAPPRTRSGTNPSPSGPIRTRRPSWLSILQQRAAASRRSGRWRSACRSVTPTTAVRFTCATSRSHRRYSRRSASRIGLRSPTSLSSLFTSTDNKCIAQSELCA